MLMKKLVFMLATAAMLSVGFVAQVQASIITTQEAMSLEARESRVAEVQALMARDDVRDAMVRLGADPEEATLRVASLSDAELMQVHGQLEQLPAGGGALAVIGIVFLVLLILDLTGVISIFRR
ncbi:MAG: PA2779 family protein [Lysobacteraceae bacterium]